jgi:anaerobic magnesium-protoporphyrin IX monomethyl ester cyclase
MKIVLVQPKVPWLSAWEALNMGYIKSYAEQFDSTWDFEFYSGFFDSDKVIIDACSNADLVGFTCTTPQMAHARRIIEGMSFSDGTPRLVIGGVHASAQPNHTLEICDYAVQGEGEMAFVKILHGKATPGIIRMPYVEDLDYLPPPDRHFIKQYRNIEVAFKDNKERIGAIFSSRGCPFACTFCSSREVWSRKFRMHSPKRVVDEMKGLVNDWSIDFIKFSDDTFTVSEKRVSEICDLIKQEGLKVPWGCNIRANTSDDLLKKMKESNCREVWVGAESGDDSILQDMKKGITTDMTRHIFKVTKELELFRRAYFMIGMPNDSWETIEKTKELAREIQADMYGFSIYDALPNNSLWKDEYLKTRNLEQMDEYKNPWTTTKTLSNEDLQVAQRMLCKEFKGKMCWRQKEVEGIGSA